MALIIGVTGAIATGKSTACEIMKGLGAVHCDADRLVHRLYDPGKPAFDRIVAIFGDEVVGDDGYIDRRILGSRVFGRPEEMSRLTTAIGDINAAVRGVFEEWRETLAQDAPAVMEAVNLIEAGYGQWCDQVWLFACQEATARQRLVARDRFTADEIDQRLASQRSSEERAPAADLVLFNDGSYDEFHSKVRAEFAGLRERWQAGELPPSRYHEWWDERCAGRSHGT